MNIPRWLLIGLGGLVLAGLLMGTLVPLLTTLGVGLPKWGLHAMAAAVAAASVFAVWVVARQPRGAGASHRG